MNDNLKKSIESAKMLLEACKRDPKLAEELAKTQGVPKGVDPDKMESCVQDVKGQKGVQNKYAVCAASLQGKTKKMEKGEFHDMVKADDQRFHQKGVHTNTDSQGRAMSTNPGRSSAGGKVAFAHSIKQGKAYAGDTNHPIPKSSPEAGRLISGAKQQHQKVLGEMKGIKPNLPKSEMSKAEIKECMKADDAWYSKLKKPEQKK